MTTVTSDSPASSTRTLEHDYVQVPAPAVDQRFAKLHECLRRLDTEVYQPALHFYQENHATHPTFSIFAAICAGFSAFPVALFILLSLFQVLLIPFVSVMATLTLLVTIELVLALKLILSLIACAGVSVVATFIVVSASPFFRDFKIFDPSTLHRASETLTSITQTVAENAPAWRDAAVAFIAQTVAAMKQLHASTHAAVLSRLRESTAGQTYIDTSHSFVQAAYRTGGVLAQVSITVAEGLVLATKGLVIFCSSLIPIMRWIVASFGSLSESRIEANAAETEMIVRDSTSEARASSSSVRSTSEVRQRFAARTSDEISSPNDPIHKNIRTSRDVKLE